MKIKRNETMRTRQSQELQELPNVRSRWRQQEVVLYFQGTDYRVESTKNVATREGCTQVAHERRRRATATTDIIAHEYRAGQGARQPPK